MRKPMSMANPLVRLYERDGLRVDLNPIRERLYFYDDKGFLGTQSLSKAFDTICTELIKQRKQVLENNSGNDSINIAEVIKKSTEKETLDEKVEEVSQVSPGFYF